MKRLNSLILMVALLVALPFLVAGQTLSNPGFESWTVNGAGGPPDNWELNPSTLVSASQTTTTVHSGSYATNLTWTTTANRDFQQIDISPITPGQNYKFSVWAYDNDPAGQIAIYIRWEDSGGAYISNSTFVYSSDSASWQELSTGFVAAPVNAAQIEVRIRCYDVVAGWDGDATVYVDDASLELPSGAPEVADAYSTTTTDMVVIFNADVDETAAETAGNYEVGDGTTTATFSAAVRDDADHKKVYLTGASPTGMMGDTTLDNLVVNDVQADGDPPGTSRVTFDLYAGISPISNIQQSGPLEEKRVTVRGIVSANDEYNQVWIQDAAGAWNGAMIYDYSFYALVDVGDDITVAVKPSEYFTMTELTEPVLLSIHSSGNTPYAAVTVTCADLDDNISGDAAPAEQYEGCLVKINNAEILSGPTGNYEYIVSDDSNVSQTYVDDDAWYHYGGGSYTVGHIYNITGVVTFSYNIYRVNPRSGADMEFVSTRVDDWSLY